MSSVHRPDDLLRIGKEVLVPIRALSWSPNGDKVALLAHCAEVWSLSSKTKLLELDFYPDWGNSLAWSPDARLLVGVNSYQMGVWDVTGKQTWKAWHYLLWPQRSGDKNGWGGIASTISTDCSMVAVTMRMKDSPRGRVGMVQIATGNPVFEVDLDIFATAVAISPRNDMIAWGDYYGAVTVQCLATGKRWRHDHSPSDVEPYNRRVNAVVFSPDGHEIASTAGHFVHIWSTR